MPQYLGSEATNPSVPAGSHEMRETYPNFDPPRSLRYDTDAVTPWLGLRSRLSQIWFNPWTLFLTVIFVQIIITCAIVNHELSSARTQSLSACSTVETMGSVMASMPHYLTPGINELTASGIEKSVNGLMQTTTLAVTGVEEIVVFVINMMYGTYFCLITLAVNGSTHAALGALDDAQKSLGDLTKGLGDDMAGILGTFETAYNDVKNTLHGATLGLSSGIDLPDLNLDDDISKLRNLSLPASLHDDIQKLEANIPDFIDVKNLTDNAIRIPFEKVKDLISENLGNYTFNRSVFPVPQKEQLSFCTEDNGINQFFDGLDHTVATAKKAFIAALVVAMVVSCLLVAYHESKRWRKVKKQAQMFNDYNLDPIDFAYIISCPSTALTGLKISRSFKSGRHQVLVRWVISYATSDAALFILCLAVAGLFSCLCQYILLKGLEKEVPQLTNKVAGFADQVVDKLNNASAHWALGANQAISDTNSTINQDMFGWVNTSTTALNDTLNQFVDLTSNVLNQTFGGTVLYDPIKDVLNCLVLLKVAGIQKGLDWIHDNAHINMPTMPNNTFSLGASDSILSDAVPGSSFLADSGDFAADKISDVVAKFTHKMADFISTELLVFGTLLGLYVFAVLLAIIRALMLWNGHDKVRGDGGVAPGIPEAQPAQQDFRSNHQDAYANFDSIPMGRFSHFQGPAPRYSTAIEEKAAQEAAENPFASTKH